MPTQYGQIFLSSTYEDLIPYREAVRQALRGLAAWTCVSMEEFTAEPQRTAAFCCKKVQECDLYVAIIGHVYGSCPSDCDVSFTEIEYDAAVASNKLCLVFLAPDNFGIPANILKKLTTKERKRQDDFRSRIRKHGLLIEDKFKEPHELSICVLRAIVNCHCKIPISTVVDSNLRR
jgi:hypothetical protein